LLRPCQPHSFQYRRKPAFIDWKRWAIMPVVPRFLAIAVAPVVFCLCSILADHALTYREFFGL
jgi:hypothetical protein